MATIFFLFKSIGPLSFVKSDRIFYFQYNALIVGKVDFKL